MCDMRPQGRRGLDSPKDGEEGKVADVSYLRLTKIGFPKTYRIAWTPMKKFVFHL